MYATEFLIRYMEAPENIKKDIEIILKPYAKGHKGNKYEGMDELYKEIGMMVVNDVFKHFKELKKHPTAAN